MRRTILLIIAAPGAALVGQLVSLVTGHGMIPLAIQAQSVFYACTYVLFAIGIVLVYRSARIINFSHAGFGALAAVMLLMLVRELHWPYLLALPIVLAGSVLLGAIVEVLLLRRFYRSSRLVLTVVTIGVAQAMQFAAGWLPTRFGPDVVGTGRIETSPLQHLGFRWDKLPFNGDVLLLGIVTAGVCAALAMFFRYTSVGIAIRGSSENDDRAQLLGVNVRSLSTLVWAVAALLSAIGTALFVPLGGAPAPSAAGVGSGLLLVSLAAAVFARLEHLPTAAIAALALGIIESSIFFVTGRGDYVEVVVLGVILVGLLAQRKQLARSQESEGSTWAANEEIRPVPEELSGVPSVRRAARRVAMVGAVLVLAYPWVASPSQTNTGSLYAIYGIIAVSLVILTGWGGQISLGQWGIAGVGAATAAVLTGRLHWPLPFTLLGACALGAGAAVLLGLPALRIRGLFLAVTTLAFAVVMSDVVLNETWLGRIIPDTISRPKLLFIDTADERALYYLCLGGLVFAVFAALGLRRSRTGRVLIAMRDNERAAQAFGVSLLRTRLATFAISGALASLGGALFAFHQHSAGAQSFPPADSVQMFLMAVIGGLGSVSGVLLGPLFVGLATTFFGDYRLLASAAGLLFVLLVAPGGFGALAYGLRDAFLRRVAIRNHIFVPSLLAHHSAGEMERTPLAPKTNDDGMPLVVPTKYRLPSRIGVAGTSQTTPEWSL